MTDKIVDAMGNRLYFVNTWIYIPKESIIGICDENECDGLFMFDEVHKLMRYYDCDGTENYCGNAVRSLSCLKPEMSRNLFEFVVGGEGIPSVSYKTEDGLFATRIRIQKLERLDAITWEGFVGNRHIVRILGDLEGDIEEIADVLRKQRFGRAIFDFIDVQMNVVPFTVQVRVVEEFERETQSCCSSASVVAKVMEDLYERKACILHYRGGYFKTRILDENLVEVAGECKLEKPKDLNRTSNILSNS